MPSSEPTKAGAGNRVERLEDLLSRNLVIAYSCRLGLSAGLREPGIGAPHFSLFLSARRFLAAFAALGVKTAPVVRPEIYGTDISRRFLASDDQQLIHVAFGDFASLRPLKGAYNIAYVAWEYPAISSAVQYGEPLWKNQRWVLGLFDEIWVGSHYAKRAFERGGLTNVHIVPAPVPDYADEGKPDIAEVIGRLRCAPLLYDFHMSDEFSEGTLANVTAPFAFFYERRAGAGRPVVYLTVINPGDQRKNVEASILAFSRFAAARPQALLVVKLVGPPEIPLYHKLWRTLRIQLFRLIGDGVLKSDAVLFVDGFLEEEDLMRLIAAADFYVSTSFAEGLNLPVLEAMSRGAVVISPIHTSMADYLSPANCIPCASRPVEVDGEAVTGYRIGLVTRYECAVEDVHRALTDSAALNAAKLQNIREQARAAVSGRYDVSGVARAVGARLGHIIANGGR